MRSFEEVLYNLLSTTIPFDDTYVRNLNQDTLLGYKILGNEIVEEIIYVYQIIESRHAY